MKFYKDEQNRLIQYNPETDIYKIRNTISKEDKRINKEDFKNLKAKEIKRSEFSRFMNIFFKNVKHSWDYKNVSFRKLDNFEGNEYSKMPKHFYSKENSVGYNYYGDLIMVYHWGKVYYFTWSYNGYPQGQLIEPTTMQIVRWAKPKNCAPIFNEHTKEIL